MAIIILLLFLVIYQNMGDNSFLNIGIEIFGTVNGTIDWGDYDNDGDLDFLLTGMSSYSEDPVTEIYRNIATDLFNKEDNQDLPGIYQSSAEWGDYDNDGDLDVVLTGTMTESGDLISAVYNNKNDFVNQIPSSPQNLISEVNNNTVLLHWEPAYDQETNSDNLTYNIKLGSYYYSSNIVSAMADYSGKRFVSSFGNAGTNTAMHLYDMEPGPYFWSVQAVDNNFAGSAFSLEDSFTINPVGEQEIINEEDLLIYPNPFVDNISISASSNLEVEKIEIMNSVGNIVMCISSDEMQKQTNKNLKLKLGQIKPGIYYFVVHTETGIIYVRKILKY